MKLRLTINVPNWFDRILVWPILEYRRRKYGYPFRKIELTEGYVAIVDPEDFYWLSNYKWIAEGKGNNIYAARPVLSKDKPLKFIRMHREIMNAPKGILVDHRNRNGLDDRRENLRLATYSENNCNKPKKKNTSSRFVGVYLEKWIGKWRAQISVDGKSINLGRFDSEIDAARAYDAAAKMYHKEFARLNFPEATTPS